MNETKVKDVFAKHIIELRRNKDMTQGEFADLLEVGVSTVSDWETGKKLPRAGAIERLARTFNISKSSLFEEENEHKNSDSTNEKELVTAIVLSDENTLNNSIVIVDGVQLSERQKRKLLAMIRLDLLDSE